MKANLGQLRAAIDRVDPAIRLYLLHGPDEAGAREFAARLARAMGEGTERIDIEGSSLRSDAGLLAAEAASLSLFGGARYIRVSGATEDCLGAVELLLSAECAGNPVLMLAPNVKTSGKLVKAVIAAPAAMSFACYPPEGADAVQLAIAIAAEHGLRATAATGQRLAVAANGDRAVLTREIEKLALFLDAAPETPKQLDESAIDAVGADHGETEMSGVIEATIAGNVVQLGIELGRARESGLSMIPVLRGLTRRLIALAAMRAEVDAGARATEVVKRHHVHFREEAATVRALRLWSPQRLAHAIDQARAAERGQMAGGGIGIEVAAAAACIQISRSIGRQP